MVMLPVGIVGEQEAIDTPQMMADELEAMIRPRTTAGAR